MSEFTKQNFSLIFLAALLLSVLCLGMKISAQTVVTTIPVENGANYSVIVPNKNIIYQSNFWSSSISVIDLNSKLVTKTLYLGANPAYGVYNPNTNLVYFAFAYEDAVKVIDPNTDLVVATIPVGIKPERQLAIDLPSNRIFVSSFYTNDVSVIDGNTNTVSATLYGTHGVGLNSQTRRLYISDYNNNQLIVHNLDTLVFIATIPLIGGPVNGPLVNPATNKVYVATGDSSSISLIDGATNTVATQIETGQSGPYFLALNSQRNRIYVSNVFSNSSTIIDGLTDSIVSIVPVGSYPVGITVDESTGLVYVSNSESADITVINDNAPPFSVRALFEQSKAYKSGSTIPIKIQILDSLLVNVSSQDRMVTAYDLALFGGTTSSPVIDSGNANPDNNFRYVSNGNDGSYIFNLSTKGLTPGTYKLFFRVGNDSNTSYSIQFEVK